jgi:pullulanase
MSSTTHRSKHRPGAPAAVFPVLMALLAGAGGCGDNLGGVNPDAGPDALGPDSGDPGPDAGMVDRACPDPSTRTIECAEQGEFNDARAHWLNLDTIAWPAGTPGQSFELHHADCGIRRVGDEILGSAGMVALTEDAAGLPATLQATFPHLAGYRALRIQEEDHLQVPGILAGQFILVSRDQTGQILAASRVQIPGVLDDLYTYGGALGLEFAGDKATFRLWAPTARWVCLHIYDKDSKQEIATADMTRGDQGVWSLAEGDQDQWYGHYYKYEVYVYSPALAGYPDAGPRMVTDPYSLGLSQNSEHSLIVDLGDPATKPAGWDSLIKPALAAPEDIVIYEAHIRDFSVNDQTVAPAHRGKYLAFAYDGTGGMPLSNGMNHLTSLQQAGLTHLHILPAFDIATIDEDPATRVELDDTFDALCAANGGVPAQDCTSYTGQSIREVFEGLDPSTGDAQRIASYMHELDGFNWGYDPFHYTAPEGSYATSAEGTTRIMEFRAMVQALARNGLRVAFDVVYNHTNSSGLNDKSVLDKIVPGYYHRLNVTTGEVERSTCCENTASEHVMMEKLMIDSALVWARQYKIDAFRFDLMGHHMKANMVKLQQALAALTPAADGVDGARIYLYGEGWNFGEVVNNTRGENATQLNMAGTGIGTFSDRLRDAVRGGGPFDSEDALRKNQGFASGMYYDPNEMNSGSQDELDILLLQADQIRVGMAGNLRDFVVVDRNDFPVKGSSVCYGSSPAGYTDDPQEVITYIAKHDNQTLWDINQYKIPTGTSMEDRVRIQNLGASIVLVGQGVPFIHMGMDMLRSKSMERDSYNSGDWFNRVDFTYQSNNWNVGLPRQDKDGSNWPIIENIIADTSIAPQNEHIEAAVAHVREMLALRKSSKLFRLESKQDVMTRVDFHNTGAAQVPGLIVMSITDGDCAGADLDPAIEAIVVVVNATGSAETFALAGATGFELHPIQMSSADAVVQTATFTEATGAFFVPARTAAVFVKAQGTDQGPGLACNERIATSRTCNALQRDVYVRGTMNEWSASPASRMVQEPLNDTRYSVDLTLDAGTYQFKIADESWGTYNWGISEGNITPGSGPHTMYSFAGDITLTISTPGVHRFTLDTQDINQPTVTVDLVP